MQELHLLADAKLATEEIDVLDLQAEDLALSEPASGSDDGCSSPALWVARDHGGDLLDRLRDRSCVLDRGSPHRA